MSKMITPPTSDAAVDDGKPRVNDLIDGRKYHLTLGNAEMDVQVVTVKEKVRDGGWYVEFHNPRTMRVNTIELSTFLDHAVSTETKWLGK